MSGGSSKGRAVDLTEAFSYYGVDGVVARRLVLADGVGALQRPAAVPVADRRAVAAMMPRFSVGSRVPTGTGRRVVIEGGWSLVVADAVSGAESLRLDLGEPGETLVHADFDGRFWVGSFEPGGVFVVDTTAAQPAVDRCRLSGRHDRHARPLRCSTSCGGDHDQHDDRRRRRPRRRHRADYDGADVPDLRAQRPLPDPAVRRGPAVRAIQQALAAAGHGSTSTATSVLVRRPRSAASRRPTARGRRPRRRRTRGPP